MNSDVHFDLPHWNYFRLLEKDLEEAFRYVQPCEEHFSVFSDHFARIILMACTEIENCLHEISQEIGCTPKPRTICDFYDCVASRFPSFGESNILIRRYSLSVSPWSQWSTTEAPEWWKMGYNKIKHDRVQHPDASTMIRAISSVGALAVVLYHYYRVKFGLKCMMPAEIAPHLFELDESHSHEGRAGMYLDWVLPGETQRDF